MFLHFSKLLFFYEYSFVLFDILANLHLVINFLHKHNFCLSFFTRLFKLLILSLCSRLPLNVYPSPSLPTHPNITLYPQTSNNISNSQHHTSITSTSSQIKIHQIQISKPKGIWNHVAVTAKATLLIGGIYILDIVKNSKGIWILSILVKTLNSDWWLLKELISSNFYLFNDIY
jgi:hypothetical protein